MAIHPPKINNPNIQFYIQQIVHTIIFCVIIYFNKSISSYTKEKSDMLSFRQYKLLKQIDIYQKATDENYQRGRSKILKDDFVKYTKFKPYTINAILSELYQQEYIKDTGNEIATKIHAVAITDKGYDTLDNYYKFIISKCFIFVCGSVITLIIEHFLDIITFIKTLFC